jgi:5-methylcytosine-specific restriction endonuclease McrA
LVAQIYLRSEARKKYLCRYYQTDKGRAYIERHKGTWRGKSAYLIHVDKKPCAVCGETNVELLECDHIVARCFGGTDDWSNLQVLCIKHHAEKTKLDLERFYACL